LRKSKDNGLNVQLYPNPANELLNIEIQTGADAQIEIEIIDEAGRTIMTQTIDKIVKAGKHKFEVNTAALPQSNYTLRVKSDHAIANHKFVIIK
jgi:hypothetical protein